MKIIEYVTEEVSRQGHDVTKLDGVERVAWMLEAWRMALIVARPASRPTFGHIIMLGTRIEPTKNHGGTRTCDVRVGNRLCPPFGDVGRQLENLVENGDKLSPLEFYKEFELIHPFVDGNGRTGKILLNWLNGTLDDPIFPPADLFGEPIRNP